MTWSAKVTINGTEYSYPDGPMLPGFKVYFRPDEIVFHWGAARDKSITPRNLGPYVAQVFNDGTLVQTYSIGGDGKRLHWWASRWLHEINPDVVIRTPADLISARLAPPFGDTGIKLSSITNPLFEGPMGRAGLITYEPTTGERSEIGVATDWSAYYIRTGEASPMIEVGKAAFTMPVFWTDENTGKPWDLIKEPSANTYSTPAQGGPWMGPWAPASTPPNPWQPDGAHAAELSGWLYFATGMDRHLEALQYRAVQMFMEDAYYSGPGAAGVSVCAPAQCRKTAWTMRELALALRATQLREEKGPLPDYLLPSATLMQMLDNNFAWFRKTYMNDPAIQTFRVWPDFRAALWQQDYLNTAFALAAMWWPDKYGDFYLWTLGSTIQRTNGKSGWPPAFQSVYYISLFADPPTNSQYLDSWGDLFQKFAADQIAGTDPQGDNGQLTQAQYDALTKDPYNGGQYIAPSSYCLNARGVLAFAVYLTRNGIIDVAETYPELEQCLASQDGMVKQWNYMTERWNLTATPQPVLAVTITQPSPDASGGTIDDGSDSGGGSGAPPSDPVPPVQLPAPTEADPTLFDKTGVLNLQTDQDDVLVDLTGKVTGTETLLFNLQGNGQTRVTVIWPNVAGYNVRQQADTPKGGKVWEETHSSGNSFVLYNCGTSLIFNGAQIGVPQADPPPSDPPPTQTEPPMSDPLSPIVAAVHAVTTSYNNLKTRLAAIAAAATANGTQVDPAELQALVDELTADQQGLDTLAPTPSA